MKMIKQGANLYLFTFDTDEHVLNYRKSLGAAFNAIDVSSLSFSINANPLQIPHVLRSLRAVAESDEGMDKPTAQAFVREKYHEGISPSQSGGGGLVVMNPDFQGDGD